MVVGVDIGGTKTAAGLVDAGGRLGEVVTAPTPGSAGRRAVLDTVVGLVRHVSADTANVVGVGVGTAGVVDSLRGVVTSATSSLSGWAGTGIRDQLTHELGLPVHVVNDVHAHALGERWRGAAQQSSSTLFVAVGTGVGGAMLLPAGLWSGSHGAAGHVGHVVSPAADGLACSCGGTGHLEAVASGPAMTLAYRRHSGRSARDLADIHTRARDGDPLALRVLHDGASALGTALGGLVNAFDPETVVVGGGVAHVGALWWEPMERALRAELLPVLVDIAVRGSVLGAGAALVGAASMAWAAQ